MMAGDWLKLRVNLWDDPRILRLCDLCEITEATVIGGLYWLWSTADQHTEDGFLPGLTLRQVDRKTAISGFGSALCAIGWLSEDSDGVRIAKFEEHNGSSAKKRCQTAKRVANHKLTNAEVTQDGDASNAASVSGALPREREEKSDKSIGHTQETLKESKPRVSKFAKPSVDEVRAYCLERENTVDPQRFIDHYDSNGWRIGKSGMADWKAAVRNWEKSTSPKGGCALSSELPEIQPARVRV